MSNTNNSGLPLPEEAAELITLCMETARTNPNPHTIDAVNRAIKMYLMLKEASGNRTNEPNDELIKRIEHELLGL